MNENSEFKKISGPINSESNQGKEYGVRVIDLPEDRLELTEEEAKNFVTKTVYMPYLGQSDYTDSKVIPGGPNNLRLVARHNVSSNPGGGISKYFIVWKSSHGEMKKKKYLARVWCGLLVSLIIYV